MKFQYVLIFAFIPNIGEGDLKFLYIYVCLLKFPMLKVFITFNVCYFVHINVMTCLHYIGVIVFIVTGLIVEPIYVWLIFALAKRLSINWNFYANNNSLFWLYWYWLGDVEHTHLVKGLDYALLNKVRSEIDKKPEAGDDGDGKSR